MTVLRAGEILGLRLEDIDFERQTLAGDADRLVWPSPKSEDARQRRRPPITPTFGRDPSSALADVEGKSGPISFRQQARQTVMFVGHGGPGATRAPHAVSSSTCCKTFNRSCSPALNSIRSGPIPPPALDETGHFYFAQTGHSHFAATILRFGLDSPSWVMLYEAPF
jgi:integrase